MNEHESNKKCWNDNDRGIRYTFNEEVLIKYLNNNNFDLL